MQARRSRPAEPDGRAARQFHVAPDARVEDADLQFLHAPIIPEPAQFATGPRARLPADFAHADQGLAAGRKAARKAACAGIGLADRGGTARDLAAPWDARPVRARRRAIAAGRISARCASVLVRRAQCAVQPARRRPRALGRTAGCARDRAPPSPRAPAERARPAKPARRPRVPDREAARPGTRGLLLPLPRQPAPADQLRGALPGHGGRRQRPSARGGQAGALPQRNRGDPGPQPSLRASPSRVRPTRSSRRGCGTPWRWSKSGCSTT